MNYTISTDDTITEEEVVSLYKANEWSSAEKPEKLLPALRNSHTLITVRIDEKLVGVGNAIADGHLVVYFPHMLVHPHYQGKGIGRAMMEKMLEKYRSYHQLMLTADGDAVKFYESMGFERAGKTEPMWIYGGNEH